MPSKPRNPTSRDIAYAAGVSQATVSRALRDSPAVHPDTKQRVLEIARQLNYRVDRAAAGLRSRQSRTIALLLFEDPTSDNSQINPFFLAMLGSITRASAARGYDLLVSFQQLSNDWHARYEVSNRADGIILLGYGDYVSYGEKLEALVEAESRFIIWGPIVLGQVGKSLGCDNFAGAREATEHLLGLGRRRIAFIGDATHHFPEFQQRHAGYADALRAAGIEPDPALQFTAQNQESAGIHAIESLREAGASFDAVYAASDLIAIGAIRALAEAGEIVPDDVSVVGFDDIPAASFVSPALTTVRQDTEQAGALLVDKLIRLIEDAPVESALIEPRLVVRDSCGARPAPRRQRTNTR